LSLYLSLHSYYYVSWCLYVGFRVIFSAPFLFYVIKINTRNS
jgi:hypothetical protein